MSEEVVYIIRYYGTTAQRYNGTTAQQYNGTTAKRCTTHDSRRKEKSKK